MSNHTPSFIGRVILTHGRTLHALAAAHSLASQGVEVIGSDETPLMMLSFSKYVSKTFLYPPASEGPKAFLDALEEKVREFQPDDGRPYVLMPTGRRTPLIARHRRRFEPYALVAAPDYAAIEQVHTKDRLALTCQRLGVPIARCWLVEDEASLERQLGEIEFPVLLKLPDAAGGVGLAKAEHADALRGAFREFQEQYGLGPERVGVVQKAVDGDDYCLAVLFNQGRLVAHMTYKNLATFPAEGGYGVLRETVSGERLARIAERLLGPLQWNGVAELDFRWNGDEACEAHLIEVNTRFWSGLFQSMESGVDFPWLLYQLTVHGDVEAPPPARIGVRTQIPLVALASQIPDLLSDEASLQRARSLLSEGWDSLLSGDIWQGLRSISAAVAEAVDPRERLARIQAWFEKTQDAKSEIFATDDPLAALGALYVIGSLIRTGKLPDEIARSDKGEAVKEGPGQGPADEPAEQSC